MRGYRDVSKLIAEMLPSAALAVVVGPSVKKAIQAKLQRELQIDSSIGAFLMQAIKEYIFEHGVATREEVEEREENIRQSHTRGGHKSHDTRRRKQSIAEGDGITFRFSSLYHPRPGSSSYDSDSRVSVQDVMRSPSTPPHHSHPDLDYDDVYRPSLDHLRLDEQHHVDEPENAVYDHDDYEHDYNDDYGYHFRLDSPRFNGEDDEHVRLLTAAMAGSAGPSSPPPPGFE